MTHTTLITGGAGFIGSHLADCLVRLGENVIVLDNLSSGKKTNLPLEADLVVGDVSDKKLVDKLVQRADSIFHLAAIVSVQECINNWDFGHSINLSASIGLFKAAANSRTEGVPVVYASSAAVYGDSSDIDCRESHLPAPISPYGADKLGCEHQASAMAAVYGLPSVGLRFFNVYGPRQDPRSPYAGVISLFCANKIGDRPHNIFGDGNQVRDFIYVDDVVDGLIRARNYAKKNKNASVFNLCTGVETNLVVLSKLIDNVAGGNPTRLVHQNARVGDIRRSLGDPSNAARDLGFKANTNIYKGLEMLWHSHEN